MATWYLLNCIKQRGTNGTTWLLAGEYIDDTQVSTAPILAAGGVLVPSTNAAATAAVGTNAAPGPVIKARKYVGEEWARLDALMIAAVLGAMVAQAATLQSSYAA